MLKIIMYVEELRSLYQSNQRLRKINSIQTTYVSDEVFNENSRDPNNIVMKKSNPIHFAFVEGISLNKSTEGLCTLEYILKHINPERGRKRYLP